MTTTPIDNFKRALGAATKAIAGEPELEISFGGDVAGIVRDQVMLPSLPPAPKPHLIAKARGEADALALRLALHDKDIHAGNMPQSGPARQVFEAMEQARVEALGGQHLSGLGDNLMAALDARAQRRGFDKPDIAKDDTSFAEAVGLYARETLTGRSLPKSTDGIMGAWREEIMLKSAGRFESLKTALDDQDTFGKFVQDLISDFDLGDEKANHEEEDDQDDESKENEEDEQNQDQNPQEDQEDQPGQTEVSDADAMEDDSADPQDMVDAENIDGDSDDSDAGRQCAAPRPPKSARSLYRLHHEF